jgi:predicted phage-related endonuclease
MIIYEELVQGTEEWLQARCGIVTASEMSSVLAKGQGKSRASYMYKLIGERITGEPTPSYSNAHMERGHEHEPIARGLYEDATDYLVREVGFITDHGVGFSPDGLVDDDGLVEIKSKLAHIQAEVLDHGKVPTEHVKQIQTGLWVSGRKWLDFVSYCPGMPLFIKRMERDEKLIEEMKEAVTLFYAELEIKLSKIMEQ